MRGEIAWMLQPGRSDQLSQRRQRLFVEARHALRFVGDDDGALPPGVLARNPRWTSSGMALLRLNAANGKHEATR